MSGTEPCGCDPDHKPLPHLCDRHTIERLEAQIDSLQELHDEDCQDRDRLMEVNAALRAVIERLLDYRWKSRGYGQFSCRSCGSHAEEINHGDKDVPLELVRRESCSRSCPWRLAAESIGLNETIS
jgi:hypothetical protein